MNEPTARTRTWADFDFEDVGNSGHPKQSDMGCNSGSTIKDHGRWLRSNESVHDLSGGAFARNAVLSLHSDYHPLQMSGEQQQQRQPQAPITMDSATILGGIDVPAVPALLGSSRESVNSIEEPTLDNHDNEPPRVEQPAEANKTVGKT